MEQGELRSARAYYKRMQKLDARVRGEGAYEGWMYREGIPVFEAVAGISDVRELPRGEWPRVGGRGTFIQMLSLYQSERGMYVVEIPGGKALNAERHLYEAFVFVLQGRGATEVWNDGIPKAAFEWGDGSAFILPLNAWHRLINGSSEPALLLALTKAPKVMNAVHDSDFVFNCDYKFTNEFAGERDFFTRSVPLRKDNDPEHPYWLTNFIPNVRTYTLTAPKDPKAPGLVGMWYRMGRQWPHGHIAKWPVGRYHMAHRHGPGAVLVGLRGKGYALVWPVAAGSRPYESGHGDQVVKIDWGPYSIYSPPDNWYHQHFSTGREPAHQIAIWESNAHGGTDLDYSTIDSREGTYTRMLTREAEGGLLIGFEDEDPAIRRMFEEELAKEGIECTMPPVGR